MSMRHKAGDLKNVEVVDLITSKQMVAGRRNLVAGAEHQS
jgi:urease beta subunit